VGQLLVAKNNLPPEAVGRFLMAAVGQFRVATNNATDAADNRHRHVVHQAAAREPDDLHQGLRRRIEVLVRGHRLSDDLRAVAEPFA